jgi:hypothetical protein
VLSVKKQKEEEEEEKKQEEESAMKIALFCVASKSP